MEEFNDWCYEGEVEEARTNGIIHSWSNKNSSNPILRKLDRALINFEWSQTFPSSEVSIKAPGISDHSPVVMDFNLEI